MMKRVLTFCLVLAVALAATGPSVALADYPSNYVALLDLGYRF